MKEMRHAPKGKVFLVGAGPGDPKLITIKGLEAIKKSDVIVYDRLAGPRLLREAKHGAKKIYVGKLPDRHTMKQEEINQLLVDLALQGQTVTRLKGGDPSVFGRVGEEAELLAENGIEFEIVPGITSAIAVPAYAGIPITHRNFSSSFAVVTGHESPEKLDQKINWEHLAKAMETVVFLMGVAKIGYISEQLMRHGMKADTPVALVRWGTRKEQATLVGTLENIAEKVKAADFKPPAVIVVGGVVQAREKIAWVEKKPLFGQRIMVTRARSQASELVERIEDLGGEPYEFPTIIVRKPERPEALQEFDDALRRLEHFDWVIFTSVNGVEFFFERLRETEIDVRHMAKATIAAVGPQTAQALKNRGLTVDQLPEEFVGESLYAALAPKLKSNQEALLPRADIARKYLPEKLREHGVLVTEVDAYETVMPDDDVSEAIDLFERGQIDAVTFTSSSTVRNLMQILQRNGVEQPSRLLHGVDIVCIGAKTAETAEELGLKVTHVAKEATISALVECLIESKGREQ